MRPANLHLKIVSLAVLALVAASVRAEPPLPLDGVVLPAANPASTPAVQRAPTVAAVKGAGVGKQDSLTAGQAGTMRELEALQRDTALAEARKKLRDLAPPPAPVAAPAAVSAPAAPVLATKAAKRAAAEAAAAAVDLATKAYEFVEPPNAKLVKLMVIGGRARADVVDGARMFTVKEGDALGRWTVSRIAADGVTVERRYTQMLRLPSAMPPSVQGPRPGVAGAFAGAHGLINGAPATFVESEKVDTKLLQSASPSDLAVAMAGSNTELPGGAGVAAGAYQLPPLPQAMKPDSTSPTAVPPLPPALGSSPSTLPLAG